MASGARFLAHGGLVVGRAEGVTSPPRFALPPRGGLLVAGFAECEDMPPAPAALPPGVGRSRGFFNAGVLRRGASRSAMSFMRAPNANLDAQILAKKPTKLGGQRRALARKRGACPRILQNRHKEQNANRPPNAKSAPLLRRSRNTGGPRTSESEGRGGCGGRRKTHPRGLSTCLASLSAVSVSPSARMISTAERTTGKARSSETRARSWRQSQTRRLGMRM